ncbi:CCA tRNA nucleotidyltransferase [Oenococcus kitaharae]|uniref:tRNA nucleotidyltransferase n=1 Tax=Oenococcus kitaharae DSM 17330 TaxID=1045004 RepID=G9WH28_9LACO|nr:CCA tRNA nucleotidyltransferase [Oenococcus kitaharae]EHN59517.1 tRNA nucleotidyltransferase [Oenococcus kitaharae DSM 17330]OEY83373.1 tRNA nucleotidyltransferase [Oenococcus kitaharae]OEY85172.1 tRNA nucleotidyltransferase [Oenococcus kitaharae]OEY86027.1 tRNA nucleotidyltransferase [Oenococcus kitaharae]
MKLVLSEKFKRAVPVLDELEKHGYQAFFVGGSVRDAILGRPINDIDITTDATPSEMKEIFKTADHYAGEKHGTDLVFFQHENYEITTFRVDGQYLDNRHPDKVFFTRKLVDDLARRDFTINAFAMNQQGQVFDYFDGLTDLANRTIKTVGEADQRFSEDALRILRAFRFSSQLNFAIDPSTLAAANDMKANLQAIAVERIYSEFTKLLSGTNPGRSLTQMFQIGIVDFLPGHQLLESVQDLFVNYPGSGQSEDAVNWVKFIYLSQLKSNKLVRYLKQWKMSRHLETQILASIDFLSQKNIGNLDLYKIGETIHIALRAVPRPDAEQLLDRYEHLPMHKDNQLQLDGQDLMALNIPKGPVYGRILDDLKKKVVLLEIENSREILLKEALHDYSNLGTIEK